MSTRVLITGLGPLCSLGQDRETFWASLTAGRSGVRRLERLSGALVTIGAEAAPLQEAALLGPREMRYDRVAQLALLAAHAAWRDAGLSGAGGGLASASERTGVILGTSRGAAESLERHQQRFWERGVQSVSPHASPLTTAGNLSGIVALRFGLRGPNLTVSAACSSATQAIGLAFDAIRQGRADLMLAGGAEACLTPFCVAMLAAAGILSRRMDAPEAAARPFDRDRDGIVLGEGAGVIVLESEAHARARGARAWCELAGFGATCDAHSLTGIPEDGAGLARAIGLALADAGLAPEDVAHVNAHGTGTVVGDRAETAALKGAFGRHAGTLAVSATKSMTGHLLGAVGGIEAAACALAIASGIVPPTINLDHPDPQCDLDFVPHHARPQRVDVALSTAMGFGGNNACLAFKKS